jgi:succinate-semialdehyde dehydrogenase/glutarate-semialdehyde dehydrogenase
MAIFEPLADISGGKRRLKLTNPATLEEIGELECQTREEVEAAVARARAAQPAWAALSMQERIDYILKLRDEILNAQDEIIDVVIRETGKPLQDALTFEVFAVCDFLSYWCKQAPKTLSDETLKPGGLLGLMKRVLLTYKPLGVVGVISPWNGPFVLTANPCIQAMLAGNTVLAKGSEVTPGSAKIFETLCHRAGIPEGVCQVLLGDGQTGADLLTAGVNKVSFTGSVNTGKKVAAACSAQLVPFTLELGGKDAMIVCADADVDKAAHGAVWGGCVNSGHFCCGVERIYVEEAIYDEFVKKVTEKAKAIRQGQQHGVEEDLGAIFWDRQLSIMEAHVEDARQKGAKILTGGKRKEGEKGLYYEPTVMVDVQEDWDVMKLETFGPILPIVKVKDVEEAIAKANDSNYGLHGSVWTRNREKAFEIARRVETGSMAINDIHMMYGVACAPFGGVKESGVGSVNGQYGLRGYAHAMPIVYGRGPMFNNYQGESNGYPHDQKKLDQMKWIMNFMWKNPIGRFFFGP